MPTSSEQNPRRLTPLAWLLAVLAVVPLLGIIFGLMAFEWGMRTRDSGGRLLAGLAAFMLAIGVVSTIGGYVYRADIIRIDGDPSDLRFELPLSPPAANN